MPHALTIIRDEHRSLAAVLKAMQYLVHQVQAVQGRPDMHLLGVTLDYIEQHLDHLHHPKEDEFLFPVLRVRDPDCAPILDALERQHQTGKALTAQLRRALLASASDPAKVGELGQALDEYAEFQWFHMSQEEAIVLPAAERALRASDWDHINAAFEASQDPLTGENARQNFREMFRRLTALVPEPMGLGPAVAA